VRDWSIVTPLKPAAIGKSRLLVPGVDHRHLARAIALDTIDAASACPRVVEIAVVTAEPLDGLPDVARSVREAHPTGITDAVAQGERTLRRDTHHAVLLGDLPGLDPADLTHALDEAVLVDRGAVADADGTGTTLVTARQGLALITRFGHDSFARHLDAGLVALRVRRNSSLTQDVDIIDHLARACGPSTTEATHDSIAVRSRLIWHELLSRQGERAL